MPVGTRSTTVWKIACELRDAGANASEIAVVVNASKAWQSRHGEDINALKREIERCFAKKVL
jgi:hypothetical protein